MENILNHLIVQNFQQILNNSICIVRNLWTLLHICFQSVYLPVINSKKMPQLVQPVLFFEYIDINNINITL